MILQLTTPKQIILKSAVPEEKVTVSEIQIISLIDDLQSVKCIININDIQKVLTLWEGQAYINIGDWTQSQANTRILQLI